MLHLALKRLNPAVLFVVQGAMNGLVETARSKVGLNAGVYGLRMVPVKPQVQFVQLFRRERVYRTFNLLDFS